MKVLLPETKISKCSECTQYEDEFVNPYCYKVGKVVQPNSIHPDCPLPDAEEGVCEWGKKWFVKYVGISGYKTSCQENDMRVVEWTDHKFCPNCGKLIKIKEK